MKKAFTLAEVLISLAIVGVISALTLPSILRINKEASIGPQLAKLQSAMEEATSRVMLDDPSKPLADVNEFEEKLGFHLTMEKIDSENYRLKDGMTISFEDASAVPKGAAGSGYKDIIVDINGKDGKPNVNGVDKFRFTLSTNGLMIAQDCAALIQSNNWKTPKNYDFASCTAYDIGGNVENNNTPQTPVVDNPKTTKQCANGSIVPINAICRKQCANGAWVNEDDVCDEGYTCWNGKVVADESYCPDEPEKYKCNDGTFVIDSADCKKLCFDDYYVQEDDDCPELCKDGETIANEDRSNCELPCGNGDLIPEDEWPNGCGQVEKNCPDGSKVVMGAKCPTGLPNTRDTFNDYVYCEDRYNDGTLKHYAWNAATGEWEHLEGVYHIDADGTYNHTGKQVNNASLQASLQGYIQTGEDGIFFKDEKYYSYNNKTLKFEETEFNPPDEWFEK